jgi:hypothetical protein
MQQCSWPNGNDFEAKDEQSGQKEEVLKAIFIADTHLLGPIKGHWFDKLRRYVIHIKLNGIMGMRSRCMQQYQQCF